MAGDRQLFRKEAIERLQSPEQLDQLMHVTNPRGWLLLVALCSVLAVVMAWSVFGRISTKVRGEGILIKRGGVLDVVAVGSGQITALFVDVGDAVERGQIVARIAQPELEQQIRKAEDQLDQLRRQDQRIRELGATSTELRDSYVEQQRNNLLGSVRAARQRLRWLERHVKKQRDLAGRGLVTNKAVQATELEIDQTRERIRDDLDRLKSLSVGRQEVAGEKEKEQLESQLRIREKERELALLEDRLEQTSRVVSPHAGRVLEVRAGVGSLASPGRPILNLEPESSAGTGLEALVYVPLEKGKLVEPGMRIKVAPSNVKKEHHGVMMGIVTQVAEFPATKDGMQRILQNELLVQRFLQTVGAAPIEVVAELVPSADTESGYRWSTEKGPPLVLGPGTPASASITVQRTPPIERVIPLFRELLGV